MLSTEDNIAILSIEDNNAIFYLQMITMWYAIYGRYQCHMLSIENIIQCHMLSIEDNNAMCYLQ